MLVDGEFGPIFKFNEIGDWVIYDVTSLDLFSNETMGVAALYSYGGWLVVITG